MSRLRAYPITPAAFRCDDGAGEVEHRFVVGRLLFPPDQESPEPIQPRVAPLHDPTTCTEAGIRAQGLRLIAPRLDVHGVAPAPNQISRVAVVVALVATEALLPTSGLWAGATNRKVLQSRFDQPLVMRVGA